MERSGGKVEKLESLSLEEFLRFAEEFSKFLRDGDIVLLKGELGAGKTTFVRGLAKGLGIDPSIVRSPTFTLMNVYPGKITLYHADLYRLDDPSQIFYVGLEEVIEEGEGILAIEWADLFEDFWDEGIWVEIVANEDGTRNVLIRNT